jgi:hypothetical protein
MSGLLRRPGASARIAARPDPGAARGERPGPEPPAGGPTGNATSPRCANLCAMRPVGPTSCPVSRPRHWRRPVPSETASAHCLGRAGGRRRERLERLGVEPLAPGAEDAGQGFRAGFRRTGLRREAGRVPLPREVEPTNSSSSPPSDWGGRRNRRWVARYDPPACQVLGFASRRRLQSRACVASRRAGRESQLTRSQTAHPGEPARVGIVLRMATAADRAGAPSAFEGGDDEQGTGTRDSHARWPCRRPVPLIFSGPADAWQPHPLTPAPFGTQEQEWRRRPSHQVPVAATAGMTARGGRRAHHLPRRRHRWRPPCPRSDKDIGRLVPTRRRESLPGSCGTLAGTDRQPSRQQPR